MKIVLAGATGFIGKALTEKLLKEGNKIIILTRSTPEVVNYPDGKTLVPWNGREPEKWQSYLDGVDAVINLAGENIAARPWTERQKQRILSSRLDASHAIVLAIKNATKKPSVFLNASAVGYYGDVPEGDVTEISPPGKNFLADVCVEWEKTAMQADNTGVRTVIARFGLVLEKDGGVLARMLPPFRCFLGGPLGSGRQWISWIHREDLISALIFLLFNENLSGAVNLASPEPCRMEAFCSVLGKILKRPSWFRVPSFVLRAMMGEMSEMILTGQKVLPEKLVRNGFRFKYPSIEQGLVEIIQK